MEEHGDRFLEARDAVDRVVNEDDFPAGPFERLEIHAHGSGDVTWRVWTPRAEEPVGGFVAADA